MERAFVACDVSNLWRACRDEFGVDARIDFQILASMLPALRHPEPVNQALMAYLVTNPKQNHQAFYRALRGYGFSVRERFMRFAKAAMKPTRTDWDVGITIDALAKEDSYDTFVLVSGDGDFAPLLRHLKTRQKNTVVFTFSQPASQHLYKAADELHLLGEDIVYRVG